MIDILFGIWLICFGIYLIYSSYFKLNAKSKKGMLHKSWLDIRFFSLGLMFIIVSFNFLFGNFSLIDIIDRVFEK